MNTKGRLNMNFDVRQQPSGTNRRKSYLINPAFQWRYAIMLGLGVFLTTSILTCLLYATLHEEARQRFVNPQAANLDAGMVILMAALGFSVLTAGTVVALSVITSHRICGPLFVLEGYFRQLVDGIIPQPRGLRKKDEFKETFTIFCKATDRLRSDRRRQFESLDKLLDLAAQADRHDQRACDEALHSITSELRRLRDQLAGAIDIKPKPAPPEDEPNPTQNETQQPAPTCV